MSLDTRLPRVRLRLSKERRMLFEEAQWRERDEAD